MVYIVFVELLYGFDSWDMTVSMMRGIYTVAEIGDSKLYAMHV
jgi:hypothetical protein